MRVGQNLDPKRGRAQRSLGEMETVVVREQGGGGGVAGSRTESPDSEIVSGGGFSHRTGEQGGESVGGGAGLEPGAMGSEGCDMGRGEGGGGRVRGGRELELELVPLPAVRALRLRNSSGILLECF